MEIEIKNLKKHYQNQMVLDLDQLHISANKITAIVGPNGAGKSTLLNLIAGLIEKDEGEIYYNHQIKVPFQDMTLVFQQPYLIHSSVKENILYPMKIRKLSKDILDQRLDYLSNELHLTHLLEKKSNQLSLGEKQKVSLARALSFYPDLLMLDEPCASIDPTTTHEIEKMLVKMNQNAHMTILFVTHNLDQAKRIADEVLLLNQRKNIEICNKNDFFEHPNHPLTQKFIKGELLI